MVTHDEEDTRFLGEKIIFLKKGISMKVDKPAVSFG